MAGRLRDFPRNYFTLQYTEEHEFLSEEETVLTTRPVKPLLLIVFLLTCAAPAARAQEYGNDTPALVVARLRQVDNINRARAAAGAPPVRLDPAANRFATLRAREAAVHGYRGHWNRDGYTPWMHWGLLGGLDHINENTHASWSRTTGYPVDSSICDMNDEDMITAAMNKGLTAFLAEGPGGGHSDNTLDPSHTHVGLGFHCVVIQNGDTVEYELRYYEEYVDRYLTIDPLDSNPAPGDAVAITGHVRFPDMGLYAAVVYYAPFPAPMDRETINAKSYYQDYTDEQAVDLWPWDLTFDEKTGAFRVPFTVEKQGLYYVQLYMKQGIKDIPYKKAIRTSTRGLACAGGIVLSVGRDLAAAPDLTR